MKMNKRQEKTPLERFKLFKARLVQDADILNVIDDLNVKHHLELLIQALDKVIFDFENPIPEAFQKQKAQDERQKFIAIFCQKYRLMTDMEYQQTVTPYHCKNMLDVINKIKEQGGTIEDYMNFLFDEFFPNNKNSSQFMHMGYVTGGHCCQQYLLNRKDTLKKNQEDSLKQTEITDVLNRYRVLLRITDRTDIRINAWYKEWKAGELEIKEFKKRVIEAEKKYAQSETDTANVITGQEN